VRMTTVYEVGLPYRSSTDSAPKTTAMYAVKNPVRPIDDRRLRPSTASS
jgi:hypothetical protein